jgi:polyketide synthase PksN
MWIRPLEVREGPEQALVSLTASDDAIEVEIASASSQDVYVEGELLYGPKGEAGADEWLDLAALRAEAIMEEGKEAIYESFRSMGFLYGSSYQVTEARFRGPTGTLSHLRLPEQLRAGSSAFVLHPSLLDAAARTCLAVGTESAREGGGPLVPFALGDIEIRHPLTEECYAYATLADDSRPGIGEPAAVIAGTSFQKYNIIIADPAGRVLVRLSDIAARPLMKADSNVSRRLQYFRYDWLETPITEPTEAAAGHTVLLVATRANLAMDLAECYGSEVKVVLAQPGESYRGLDGLSFQFDARNDEGHRQLIAALEDRSLLPDRIVYCLEQGGESGVYAIRSLFLALEAVRPGRAARCAVLFEGNEGSPRPHDQAVSALAKSLLTINHRFELFTIEWDGSDATRIAPALVNELGAEGNPTGHEIAYRTGQRYRRRLIAHAMRESEPLPLQPRGVYLITGGAGKLGLVFARHLASRYSARLILTGRSRQLNESQEAAIRELQKAGADVHYCSADIADVGEAAALVQFAKARYGEINGILHCAGLASRSSIMELDRGAFESLLAPKVDGIVNLDRLTEHEPLAFFAAFSSVSAMLGDPGAGAYAVGNRFMDSYALCREALRVAGRRSGKTLSINWPLWATGGMALPDEEASVFQFSGMVPLTDEEGIAAFESALRGELAQVLIAAGDVEKIARILQVHRPTRMPAPAPVIRPQESGNSLKQLAEQLVKERLAVVVKASPSTIDAQITFEQCGMDSVMMMELRDTLSKEFGSLPKTVLFEHDTPERLAQYLVSNHEQPLRARVQAPSQTAPVDAKHISPAKQLVKPAIQPSRPLTARAAFRKSVPHRTAAAASKDDVAIIGVAGQFPKAADLLEFWGNVQSARDCVTDIPPERWDASRTGISCRRGGFLADVGQFDPALFRMTPAEAAKTDPQVRAFLCAAWQALEDSAYTPEGIASQRVGVYAGAMNEDFTWIMSDMYARTGEYIGPGSMASDLANRISFLMNFRGPSLTVGTACSSSLTAIHLARRAILDDECDMALAGAVNLSLHPSKYLLLRDMKVLSPDGQERTFDDAANGLVPSEGVGVVVLKRLSQALKDGDQVYGVIRSSCLSHSGTGAGQFLPNIRVMEETVARGIREAGIEANELTYIESHGTGTALGDPIELKALANAMRQFTPATQFCAIGTRANLGHMEAASGVCALIKVLLSMKHGRLSPCARLESVNASFEQEASPFFFPRSAQQWQATPGRPLIAGINSFGMGGSNAFMIVESLVPAAASTPTPSVTPSIVVLSARSDERLRAYLSTTVEFLVRCDEGSSDAQFANLAYSSQVGRMTFGNRLAIVAAGREDFIEKARAYLAGKEVAGVFAGRTRSTDALTELLSGSEGRDFVAALINSRQWDKIAAIWARGGAIDWANVHNGARRQRVSFPTSPFESIRCDIRDSFIAGVRTPESAQEPIPRRDIQPGVNTPDVKVEWFNFSPAMLGDAVLPPDIESLSLESGDEWAKQYWLDHLGEKDDTNRLLTPLLALEQSGGLGEDQALQSVSEVLNCTLIESLQRCTQTHQVEIETLIVAAWAILVNRYTKARCSQFGVLRALTPIQKLKSALRLGTGGVESEADLTEHLRNLIPVRICTVVREKISQWLERLQRNLNRKHVYGHIPLQQIEGWLGVASLFDSVIVFEKTGQPRSSAARAVSQVSQQLLASEIFSSQTRVVLELTVTIHSDAVELTVLYRAGSAVEEKVRTLLEHFKVLLEGLATNPHRNPAALPMRTKTESRETFWKTLERVNP